MVAAFLHNKVMMFLVLIVLSLVVQSVTVYGQCVLSDPTRDVLFVEFERVEPNSKNPLETIVVLRLKNNSSCSVLITAGSADKFRKPLRKDATALERVRPEYEPILPDGAFVPEMEYQYGAETEFRTSVRSDMLFEFELDGARSVLFGVPLGHFGGDFEGIAVSFNYKWERMSRAKNFHPSVVRFVRFRSSSLPETVRAQIARN
jgi:hypothetical protein